MVRRNSNQRITKIKRDIDLDLLEQAELIPVEQGCTVMNPGDNLIPYPTINNLRSWVRQYLLSGINGIFISGTNAVVANGYQYEERSAFYSAVPKRKEEYAAGYLKFTTILDGLVINTQEVKVIDCADDFQDNENTPKPGLQLSNFHYLWEHTLNIPEQSDGATTKIARIFREWKCENSPSLYSVAGVGTVIPTWIGVGYLQDSNANSYSYSWHYWDTDGILAQNNQKNNVFIWPYRKVECSEGLSCPVYYALAGVDWWDNLYRTPGWRTFWTMPVNINCINYILNTSNPNNIQDNIAFSYVNSFKALYTLDKFGIYLVCTGMNANLSNELLQSPYTQDGSVNLTLNCSDGVTTKEMHIFHSVSGLY